MDDLRLGDIIEVKNAIKVGDMTTTGEWNEEGELVGVFWTSAHVKLADSECAFAASQRGETWRKKGQSVPTFGLSEHFTWYEALYSDTAKAQSITNFPTDDEAKIIKGTTAVFMEQVRAVLGGAPITVTSWFRCEALNEAVGGSSNSEHRAGRAVDFIAPEFGSAHWVALFLAEPDLGLQFNQLIYEHVDGAEWVHISTPAPGETAKREVLTITDYGTYTGIIT